MSGDDTANPPTCTMGYGQGFLKLLERRNTAD